MAAEGVAAAVAAVDVAAVAAEAAAAAVAAAGALGAAAAMEAAACRGAAAGIAEPKRFPARQMSGGSITTRRVVGAKAPCNFSAPRIGPQASDHVDDVPAGTVPCPSAGGIAWRSSARLTGEMR